MIAWYSREQWPRLREISTDAAQFETTYAEWLAKAEGERSERMARGIPAETVAVDVDALEAWCRERGLPVDAAARRRYAAHLLRPRATDPPQKEPEPSDDDIPF